MLSSYLLRTKFICSISLIFVTCLQFINICKDLFVCYSWIDKLNVHNLLACLLSLICLTGFTYFHFITLNTVIDFTIAICIYSTEIGNQSSIYCCLQPFVNLGQLHWLTMGDTYPFLTFPYLTYYLEDAGIVIF